MKNSEGTWSGLSVELWEALAGRVGIRYQWREYPFEDLLKAVANADVDVAVGPISLTSDREVIMDFTHPYFVSDLAIAVPRKAHMFPWAEVAKEFFTSSWLKIVACLLVMLLLASASLWLFERHRNRAQFGGNWHHGLGSSFWWAAVTMSGVGYGDKAPITFGGRAVGLVWMFISVITVALVTASVTSAVVATRAANNIHSPHDLGHAHVSVLNGSTAEKFCIQTRLDFSLYPTMEATLQAVMEKEVDACIGDEAELRYIAKERFPRKLEILPFSFQREECSFALPTASPWIEPLNRALLDELHSDHFRSMRAHYLGNE